MSYVDLSAKNGEVTATYTSDFEHIEELEQRIAELEEQLICNTCAGNPISDMPCICGGTGTIHGEVQGLREACFDLKEQLKTCRNDTLERAAQIASNVKAPFSRFTIAAAIRKEIT